MALRGRDANGHGVRWGRLRDDVRPSPVRSGACRCTAVRSTYGSVQCFKKHHPIRRGPLTSSAAVCGLILRPRNWNMIVHSASVRSGPAVQSR